MSRRQLLLSITIVACVLAGATDHPRRPGPRREAGGPYPSDWFGMQRAFPGTRIPQEKFRAAVAEFQAHRTRTTLEANGDIPLRWQQVGPFNVGGRITAMAVAPGGATIFIGAANGGVFRSTNAGQNWTPVFDYHGVFSIGALALHPASPSTIWVGTGESNASVDSYDGAGVYRSDDGGEHWTDMGLKETARIGRVAIDPSNPDRVFVAAMGTQFSTGPHRGLYRTEDGGESWSQVLFVNDSTGVADVVVNPAHPETVFCATWERIRRPTYRRAFGPGCGIWRSVDSGTTWTRLSNGLPAPSDNVGRIGLAIAPSQPSTVYAQIITGSSGGYAGLGMYRTTDGGDTWVRRDLSGFTGIFGGFGWYFGETAVDPVDPERVYALGVTLVRSLDGGVTFSSITGSAHVDQHAIWIDPNDSNHLYLGNDGGFYSATAGGGSWTKSVDLPITQFYAGTIDPSNPNVLYGGTQDNNTLKTTGPPNAWFSILGGDGFYCQVHPTGPDTVFSEYQFCSNGAGPFRSSSGGAGGAAPTGLVPTDRYNWSTPFLMAPSNPRVMLLGSQRVYKSTDNGRSYVPVSGDLTTNPSSLLTYGTISTIDISPVNNTYYYVGTDDGKVWRSLSAGVSWNDISAGLPQRWVTRVTADNFDPHTVYVTLSGFGQDERLPHVYRSTNDGTTWISISGNLPDVPANDILVDPNDPLTLYLATDVGVYATRNLGQDWFPLGTGMPVQTVFDLTLHAPTRTLIAATHGRSQWKLDLNELPLAVRPTPGAPLALSPPRPNPSRGPAHLSLELPDASSVEVSVYDAMGRRVRALLVARLEAGRHDVAWDGRDDRGQRTRPGVFFVRASSARATATVRLVRAD